MGAGEGWGGGVVLEFYFFCLLRPEWEYIYNYTYGGVVPLDLISYGFGIKAYMAYMPPVVLEM